MTKLKFHILNLSVESILETPQYARVGVASTLGPSLKKWWSIFHIQCSIDS